MTADLEQNIRTLFRIRAIVRLALTAVTLACFALFLAGMTIFSDLFTRSITEGSSITLGLFVGISIIIVFVLLEFLYILACRFWFDPLQIKIEQTTPK